jgi:hypothetical protein
VPQIRHLGGKTASSRLVKIFAGTTVSGSIYHLSSVIYDLLLVICDRSLVTGHPSLVILHFAFYTDVQCMRSMTAAANSEHLTSRTPAI